MSKQYCVIIGDIIQSKEVKNRGILQNKFYSSLKQINKKYGKEIAADFMITLGDEFQGVLKNTEKSYEIIAEIQQMLSPVLLRFGVGYGTISTPLKKETAGMDGPAFHFAREAILLAKKRARRVIFKLSDSLEVELSLNTLAFSLENIEKDLTSRQREVAFLYRHYANQKKVARSLKIAQPTVAKILASSKWDWYAEVVLALKTLLSSI